MTKNDIIYIHNILKNFYKNRNLHKYEKKLINQKKLSKLEMGIKKLNVLTSDEYISFPLFKMIIKKTYNKRYSIVEVLKYIDKFDYKQFENEDDFYKMKFIYLQDLRSQTS